MNQIESFKRFIQLVMSGIGLLMQVFFFRYYYYSYIIYWIKLDFWARGHILIVLIYAFLLFVFSSMYGGTRIGYKKNGEAIFSQAIATVIVNIITYLQLSLMCMGLIRTKEYFALTLSDIIWSFLWISFVSMLYKRLFPARKVLLVHSGRNVEDIVQKLETRKDKYIVSGTININEGMDRVCEEALLRYDAVFIWDITTEERNRLLKFCYGKNIRTYVMPKISDVILSGAEQLHIFDTPILLTREYTLKFEQRVLKRLIDLVCSIILIIISSPFMLLTAIAVKLQDGGPILYKQVRCTINGKEYKILKFRSMRVDAEKDGVARLAKENDSRITPVGKFIRKCRLDELPQLFNILVGDMSFIGPRPERPEIIAQYMETMPEFAFRMKVKAGLAGYAQVYGKYNTTPLDKLKLDLCYIENYSVWLDIKLMLLTIKVLFLPDATEGVAESQTTALKNKGNSDAKEEK